MSYIGYDGTVCVCLVSYWTVHDYLGVLWAVGGLGSHDREPEQNELRFCFMEIHFRLTWCFFVLQCPRHRGRATRAKTVLFASCVSTDYASAS